jgi:hypothetical protein
VTQERLDAIAEEIGHLMQVWNRTRQRTCMVIPSEPIEGKTIDELRQLRFWVGYLGIGSYFNLEETVIILRFVFEQIEQIELIETIQRSQPTQKSNHSPIVVATGTWCAMKKDRAI